MHGVFPVFFSCNTGDKNLSEARCFPPRRIQMAKIKSTPITIFTADQEEARLLASREQDSRAMTSGPGTLKFHRLIAEHGAGVFKTLYCPVALKPLWRTPAGGIVMHTAGAQFSEKGGD
jgi:hypothetical protein